MMRVLGVVLALALPMTAVEASEPVLPSLPSLPVFEDVDLAFSLIDHTGRAVTEADFDGRPMVLFFGFASCQSICPVALYNMAQALDLLGGEAEGLAPIMVTIDPERDTPAALAEAMPRHHPSLIGLTGDEDALAALRARFQVKVTLVAEDPTGAPIYAHGSFVYLIGGDGRLRTALPPILGPEKMAELIRKYL
ncbi:MAG: SCO family protein [Pseudomonadota bacterium]